MALSSQSTYLAQAQTIAGLWNELILWYYRVKRLAALTTENGAQNVWKAMATSAQNSDGSLGNADGSPVNTDPITIGGLGMTADDIINSLNDMSMICSVLDGTGGGSLNASINHLGDAPSVTNLIG